MIRNMIKGICAIMLSVTCFTATAIPIVDSVGNVTNLDVNGELYNVTWNFGNTDPDASTFSLFTGNQAFADNFMDAVLLAFNVNNFTGAAGQQFYGVDYETLTGAFVVDDDLSAADFAPLYRTNGAHAVWSDFGNAGFGFANVVAAVPEPSIVILMTSGLIAFGVARRKSRM